MLVAMYHRTTDDDVKDHVQQSLAIANGEIRVLFATVAFGMGVDVKGCHTVIHYSLPKNPACYFQESGRCGRDGQQSYAVLVKHTGWRAGRIGSSEEMVAYSKTTRCRRRCLLEAFDDACADMTPYTCVATIVLRNASAEETIVPVTTWEEDL